MQTIDKNNKDKNNKISCSTTIMTMLKVRSDLCYQKRKKVAAN